MPVLADPIVRTKLMEFRATVDNLIQAAPLMSNTARIAVIRALCQLSRDTKFDLGSIKFADSSQAQDVAACFEQSVEDIGAIWPVGEIPDEATGYLGNILDRAKRCILSR